MLNGFGWSSRRAGKHMARLALITGGAQGLGAAMAQRLHADGWAVWIADLQGQSAEECARALAAGGGAPVQASAVDVTLDASVRALMDEVSERFGRLDLLVNCAGTIARTPAEEIESAAWARLMDVHLGGAMRCCREAFPLLLAGSWPSVVNLGSVGTFLGMPLRLAYSTAKSGIAGFTRTLASEWGPRGIRVNAITPGYIDTALMRSGFDLGVLDEEEITQRTPLRRLGVAEDIAGVTAFLASPDAAFITGAVIPVDGGVTISGDFRPRGAR